MIARNLESVVFTTELLKSLLTLCGWEETLCVWEETKQTWTMFSKLKALVGLKKF